MRIASLESLITNIVRTLYPVKGKKPEMTTPSDFMIEWGKKEEQRPKLKKQSQEEMKQILLGIASVQGTRDKIEKK